MRSRHDIKQRLLRLLRLADGTPYEAEAVAAAEAAARLMRAHGLTYADANDVADEIYATDTRPWFRGRGAGRRRGRVPVTRLVLPALAELCSVEVAWLPDTGEVLFFGAPHETATAHHLLVVIGRAMEAETTRWRKSITRFPNRQTPQARVKSFEEGMALRIAARLFALAAEAHRPGVTGGDLVAVKNARVRTEFHARHTAYRHRETAVCTDLEAARAGYAAGERTRLDTAVTQHAGVVLRIGSDAIDPTD